MRTVPEIMPIIDECKYKKRRSIPLISSTWQLIISALEWSFGKTDKEIRARIERCEARRDKGHSLLKSNWQIIISSLEWVLGEEERDPITMRKIAYGGVL